MKPVFHRLTLLSLFAALTLSACSKEKENSSPQLNAELKQEKVPAPSIAANSLGSRSEAVKTEITIQKSGLLNRTFLYGSSLQFSSLKEDGDTTALMAISIGQMPAEFRIVDNKLRLITDSRLSFESDINHPSRLVHEFVILKQDAESITIMADKASPVLHTFLFGDKTPAPIASWIRSMDLAKADELILIESSLELADGSYAEFMESIRPLEKQVPKDVKPIFADASIDPRAERFRFLDAGKVFLDIPEAGRIQTAVAQRYLIKENEPVQWYVTRNIPEKYIVDVKNGLEAWNRYSRAAGKSDLVRFAGLLPDGVKVGDPRYNIIVWDNVQDAGSAYESQLSDPLSGIQANSLIYLPLAWVNIGKDYWSLAGHSEEADEQKHERIAKLLKKRNFMGRKLPVNCLDSAHLHLSVRSKQDPETFARTLLKGVLFHEVGHALGLAHNFKGSLSFDAENKNSIFTTSIMDYNQYNEEEGAFSSVDSGDGPLLEYDRQIISVLYNEGKDVKEEDALVPVCNDEEADSLAGGVDPLCVRYDIGKDPTKQVQRSLELLTKNDSRSGRMHSLPKALENTLRDLPLATEVKNLDQALIGVKALLASVKGISNIYIGGSANSLGYQASQAMRNLRVFRDGSITDEYSEVEMRERTLSLLETLSSMESFPEATKLGLKSVKDKTKDWLLSTPAMNELPEADRAQMLEAIQSAMDKSFAANEAALLSRVRTRIAGQLGYSDAAPLSFHERNGEKLDLESHTLGILEKLAETKAGGLDRPIAERAQAVKTLISFKRKSESGKAAVERVKSKVEEEIRKTNDSRKREELRKLLEALAA
jgi:hypothetical protein